MIIRAKSVIFKKDETYTVISKVYEVTMTEEPSHLDLVNKAIKKGFSDKNFIALSVATWDPYTVDIYPDLKHDVKKKIVRLIKKDIIRILNNKSYIEKLKESERKEK